VVVDDLLRLLRRQRFDFCRRHVEITGEHRDNPCLVLDRGLVERDWPIDGLACPDALPEIVLRDLEVVTEDAAEASRAHRFLPGVRNVRLQHAPAFQQFFVEDVPLAAAAAVREFAIKDWPPQYACARRLTRPFASYEVPAA
jgi:hypothetical protein